MADTARLAQPHNVVRVQRVGAGISRYGLSVVIGWIGAMKFFPFEAEGIQPLVATSPLMSWLYNFLSVSATSAAIGVVEIAVAVLIASYSFAPRLSASGSIGAVVLFLTTLSFMITSPGVWQPSIGFGVLGSGGEFLIKDLVLLGVAVSTAGEALATAGLDGRR